MTSRRWVEESEDPLRPLRAAAAARVQHTTLRGAAREIGLSAVSLRRFVRGLNPYTPDLNRLRAWYLQHPVEREGGMSREDVQAAVGILVREVAPEVRDEIADGILNALARGYDRSGKSRPAWISDLFGAPGPVLEPATPGRRPSARGRYKGMLCSTEEFLRRKHEEIDEEERSGLRSTPAPFSAEPPPASDGARGPAGELATTEVMMISREAALKTTEARQPAGQLASVTTEPRKRGSAFGKFRDTFSSTEEFLRRKHEEIEEEERRWV